MFERIQSLGNAWQQYEGMRCMFMLLDPFHLVWDFSLGMGLPTFRTGLLWLNLSGDSLTDTQRCIS